MISVTKKTTPFIEKDSQNDEVFFHLSGLWTFETLSQLYKQVEKTLKVEGEGKPVCFEGSDVEEMDTAGARILFKAVQSLKDKGRDVTVEGLTSQQNKLFKSISEIRELRTDSKHADTSMRYYLAHLGEVSVNIFKGSRESLSFFGLICVTLAKVLANPRRLRFKSIIRHMHEAGVDALPIVVMMGFLISIVLAYQGIVQLQAFGAEIYTINLTAVSILREMGVLLTAVLVAGRSGSAFAAEIGVMKLNEEVDAMKTMGLNPMEILVIPRVIALILVLPLLTFFADIAGLIGGAFSVALMVGIPLERFMDQMQGFITIWTFLVGLIKAPFFGFIIAFVATHSGMMAKGSAESVGKMTTSAVVKAIFLVIFADALFSILFVQMGI